MQKEGRREGGKRGAKRGRDREGHSSSCATTVSKHECVCVCESVSVSMSRRKVWIGQRGHDCPHRWPESKLPNNPMTARLPARKSGSYRGTHGHTRTHARTQPLAHTVIQTASQRSMPARCVTFCCQYQQASRQTESIKGLQSCLIWPLPSLGETENNTAAFYLQNEEQAINSFVFHA